MHRFSCLEGMEFEGWSCTSHISCAESPLWSRLIKPAIFHACYSVRANPPPLPSPSRTAIFILVFLHCAIFLLRVNGKSRFDLPLHRAASQVSFPLSLAPEFHGGVGSRRRDHGNQKFQDRGLFSWNSSNKLADSCRCKNNGQSSLFFFPSFKLALARLRAKRSLGNWLVYKKFAKPETEINLQ